MYLWVKFAHILSAIVLFGVGLGTAFHLWRAHLTGDAGIIAAAARSVVLADWVFTAPAVVIQPVTGIWLIYLAGHHYHAPWLMVASALYVVAGICWLIVVRLQLRMARLAREAAEAGAALPEAYHRDFRRWFALGWPAFIAMLGESVTDIRSIAMGITAGHRQARGVAVVEGILSTVGKPFERLRNGNWEQVHGWQDIVGRTLTAPKFGTLGSRWFAACDVPDHKLFADIYPRARTITFHAGLELEPLHFGLWLLSWLVRWRLIASLKPFAKLFHGVAARIFILGSGDGRLFVDVEGQNADSEAVRKTFTLIARSGHGPNIPCIPAIILARKFAAGSLTGTGAMTCLGMITLDKFEDEIRDLDIRFAIAD